MMVTLSKIYKQDKVMVSIMTLLLFTGITESTGLMAVKLTALGRPQLLVSNSFCNHIRRYATQFVPAVKV